MFSWCACATCLRTASEYWKRSPQMRQCHWSRAKMYGRHSGLFGSSLGLGIFKSCKKNRNHHSDRATTPLRGASIRITAAGAAAIMHQGGDPSRGPVSEFGTTVVVGRPLQLSRWVEAVPASNRLAAATGNGAFWPRQETTP